ncbi:MAG: GGDEF domain-containing protein [Nitrospirae bacterium]|nr:GGDEF domain-containing protein [Nitrospirota bacterium]
MRLRMVDWGYAFSRGRSFARALSLRVRLGMAGVLLGLGAPTGWLLLRFVEEHEGWAKTGGWLAHELQNSSSLYLYLTLCSLAAFSFFGFVLGTALDRLRRQRAELVRANRKLQKLSVTDPLTGLGNRRYCEQRLEEELARAQRYDRSLALLLLDLNGFKAINDRYGHAAGDDVLAQVGAALREAIRRTDSVFRFGGDEFVVLLPETTDSGIEEFKERMSNAIRDSAQPNLTLDAPVSVTIGQGVVPPGKRSTPEMLIHEADRDLYLRKRKGPPAREDPRGASILPMRFQSTRSSR